MCPGAAYSSAECKLILQLSVMVLYSLRAVELLLPPAAFAAKRQQHKCCRAC